MPFAISCIAPSLILTIDKLNMPQNFSPGLPSPHPHWFGVHWSHHVRKQKQNNANILLLLEVEYLYMFANTYNMGVRFGSVHPLNNSIKRTNWQCL
jgi:hypothetical protein